MKEYCVYILASKKNGTLYIGRTEDLAARIFAHKNKAVAGFTKKYGVSKLVYFERYDGATDAAQRENAMKKWKRQWKINVIEENNPEWGDLYYKLNQ